LSLHKIALEGGVVQGRKKRAARRTRERELLETRAPSTWDYEGGCDKSGSVGMTRENEAVEEGKRRILIARRRHDG